MSAEPLTPAARRANTLAVLGSLPVWALVYLFRAPLAEVVCNTAVVAWHLAPWLLAFALVLAAVGRYEARGRS